MCVCVDVCVCGGGGMKNLLSAINYRAAGLISSNKTPESVFFLYTI